MLGDPVRGDARPRQPKLPPSRRGLSPGVVAARQRAAAAARTVDRAIPGLSARDGLAPWQVGALNGLLLTALLGVSIAPGASLIVLMIVSSAFFLGVWGLRAAALVASPPARPPAGPLPDEALPAYTVLVPLYREANMVASLIAVLDRLDYPAEKLDIRLIVEADDTATRRALAARILPPRYRIVTVPHTLPKTKPKALNYALVGARGALVTIFDAEDWPEPGQLRAAAATFARMPADVACLQARLAWYNWTDGWLTRQFAIEYAALFDVLLPGLDRLDLPL